MKVIVLDHAQFTITVITQDNMHIALTDSVPFSYLLDDREDKLILTFENKAKLQVSFNLIAPVNELILSTINDDDPKKN